jgi:hypothetical protein
MLQKSLSFYLQRTPCVTKYLSTKKTKFRNRDSFAQNRPPLLFQKSPPPLLRRPRAFYPIPLPLFSPLPAPPLGAASPTHASMPPPLPLALADSEQLRRLLLPFLHLLHLIPSPVHISFLSSFFPS